MKTKQAKATLFLLVAVVGLALFSWSAGIWQSHQLWRICDIDLTESEIQALVLDPTFGRGLAARYPKEFENRNASDGVWQIRYPDYKLAFEADSEYDMVKYKVRVTFGAAAYWTTISTCRGIVRSGSGDSFG